MEQERLEALVQEQGDGETAGRQQCTDPDLTRQGDHTFN